MPTKMFNTKAEADRFEKDLPPCKSITRTHTATLAVTLKWEPLKLRRLDTCGAGFFHTVIRETEHAYIIRDEKGLMMKVNRYTLLGNGERYELV